VTSVKFVVNCLVVYGKSLWKVIVLSNVCIIKFYYQNQCSVRETFRAISPNKSSLARPIFGWMDMWTSKIIEFGTIPIYARCNSKCIPRKSGGFWSGGIIGPYFFQNEAGVAIIVNGERYRSMISNFLWPKMNDMDTNNMWFQQDGATHRMPRWTFCTNDLRAWLSRAAAMWTGHRNRAI